MYYTFKDVQNQIKIGSRTTKNNRTKTTKKLCFFEELLAKHFQSIVEGAY